MVEIGGRPIIWHIMRHYAHYGHKEFYIALGYKGEVLKKYMVDYAALSSDLTVDMRAGTVKPHANFLPDWVVNLVDTGQETMTGGRIKRLAPYLKDGTFMLTWGDGVADIDLDDLLAFHRSHGKLATLTAVRPRPVMVTWSSRATGWPSSTKSRRLARAGSTVPSLCWNRKSLILLMGMTRNGSGNQWSAWPRVAN